jgi:group II intron reverse transcriptase/maturase
VFTTLAHCIDMEWMREAYRRTRKNAAPGIDGRTGRDYEERLEENLRDLLDRFQSGRYRAPALRRGYIPKADGRSLRPIGIPTFEDKVLQRAVVMVLEVVYEQDFLNCSYGFRPGRSAHQALQALWKGLMDLGGGWVVDVDIQGFFDSLDKKQLRGFLDQRVRDGVIRRAIGKWMNAGVMEGENVSYPEAGTPQGGVISPLLANVYLHEVVDVWFETMVKPRLKGAAFLIRYADDVVIVCAVERDSRRILEVLPKRLAKYGLTLHPQKTRLLRFTKPDAGDKPQTFSFLGFTHYWGKSRKGHWVVKQKTEGKRFGRALHAIAQWCKHHRHWKVDDQHRMLSLKLRGHFGYYGITGNSTALGRFRYEARRIWRKWLNRRSQRAYLPWDTFLRLEQRYPLPSPIAVHSLLRCARP